MLHCTKRGLVARAIDNIKKDRGEMTSDISELRMSKVKAESQSKALGAFKLK